MTLKNALPKIKLIANAFDFNLNNLKHFSLIWNFYNSQKKEVENVKLISKSEIQRLNKLSNN